MITDTSHSYYPITSYDCTKGIVSLSANIVNGYRPACRDSVTIVLFLWIEKKQEEMNVAYILSAPAKVRWHVLEHS